MNYNKIIDDIRHSHVLARFESEREYLEVEINNPDRDHEEFKDRLDKINKILDTLKQPKNNTKNEGIYEEINKYLYKKPWNRLNPIQRSNKMREYLKTIIVDETFRSQVETEIIKHINDKKLHTKKSVVYDHVNEKVESVPALKLNMDSKTYEIKA